MKKIIFILLFLVLLNQATASADVEVIQKLEQEVKTYVTTYVSKHGVVPSQLEARLALLRLMRPYESVLSDSDRQHISSIQDGMLDALSPKSTLISLFEAKVKAIGSIKIEYKVDTVAGDKKKFNRFSSMDVTCIVEKDRFYSDKRFTNDQTVNESGVSRETFAYNGEHMSVARYYFDDSRVVEGRIRHFTDLTELLPFGFPLYYCCLLEPEIQRLAGIAPILNLSKFFDAPMSDGVAEPLITFIKKNRAVEGRDCLFVSNGGLDFYLDPLKDYSVVKIVLNRPDVMLVDDVSNTDSLHFDSIGDFLNHMADIAVDSEPGFGFKQSGAKPYMVVVMTDLVDYGNGIWLPQKIVIDSSFDDKNDQRVVITVSTVELNKRFDENVFVDVFPKNAFIVDAVRELVYEWGDESINDLLHRTVKSKRVWIFQIVSMTLGILMIIAWIILQYRAYIKRKYAE